MLQKIITFSLFLPTLSGSKLSYANALDIFFPNNFSPEYETEINWPYQNCNEDNKKYTDLLVSYFQAIDINISPETFGFLKNLYFFKKTAVPKQCFLAMALRGNRIFKENQYSACISENASKNGNKKLCINEDYIEMIQKVWTNLSFCFDYNLKKQKKILQMINHESGGILNVRSSTGAKCLGQITNDFVEDINKIIKSTESSKPLPYSEIYKQVEGRCPDLEDKIFKNSNRILCKSIRDPYKCLFYTFFGFELSLHKIHDKLKTRTNRIPEEALSDLGVLSYYLPIRRNEMMNVVVSSGNEEKQTFTFWDDLEVYNTFKNHIEDENFLFLIEKVPLFKKTRRYRVYVCFLGAQWRLDNI